MTQHTKNLTILGIESSCDETAAAVYRGSDGILSNVLFSQIDLHQEFGGVVPEIASRAHLDKINGIVSLALSKAGVTLDDIDIVAVTNKPGLAGSLLIGLCFAKAIAWSKQKKLIGVNHLEGHAFSACIEHDIPFPFLCLTASGGHTSLYLVHDYGSYEVIGETVDDAAGEAFDKVAKLMNLPYPGGPVIEKLAKEVNFIDTRNYPRSKQKTIGFSFSGLKTAVLYDLVKQNAYDMSTKKFLAPDNQQLIQAVASSLLVCISDIFKQKIKLALTHYPEIKAVSFVGGVACNNYIRNDLEQLCKKYTKPFFYPSRQYCTDNAAMIAYVGHYKALQGNYDSLELDIFD